MRLERFARLEDPAGKAHYALSINGEFRLIKGNIYRVWSLTGKRAGEDWKLLPPCKPSKIICLGLNYKDHADEMGVKYPSEPILFMKPATALLGHGGEILWPDAWVKRLDYEAELAVVIGKECHNCSVEDASQYIFGYTCANDITARDLQPSDGQWTLAKSFDTFCPLGPVIVRGIEGENLNIATYVNGELKQYSNTGNLIFNCKEAVSYISKCMTLLPGDIILTGTPSGISPLKNGDVVVVEIEGIGRLENKVQAISNIKKD